MSGAVAAWETVGWGAQPGEALAVGVAGVVGVVVGVVLTPVLRRVLRLAPTPPPRPAPAPPAEPRLADTPRAVIDCELERSRRHGRSFAVIRLPGQAAPRPPAGEGASPRARWNGLRPQVRRPLSLLLRSIDRCCFDRRDIYLVLPETTRTGATRVVARIEAEVPGASGPQRVRMVVFPEDGVTAASLLRGLQAETPTAPVRGSVRVDFPVLPVLPVGDLASASPYHLQSAQPLAADEV